MGVFRFKDFSVSDGSSAMKVGTDAVLLGAAMTLLPSDLHLLDAGTGSGVIALMAARRLAAMGCKPSISAIDIDPGAISDACSNFASSPWAGFLHAECTPLALYPPGKPLDLIFSNPPYFEQSLKNPDARSAAARHTESLSYRELCSYAEAALGPEGRLSMILPAGAESDLIRTAAASGLYPFRLLRIRSTATKAYSRLIAEFCTRRTACREDELTLLAPDGSRSPEYSTLTGEFYL